MRCAATHELRVGHDDGAVHVAVAAGLEHHAFADVIVVGEGVGALVQEGGVGEEREA